VPGPYWNDGGHEGQVGDACVAVAERSRRRSVSGRRVRRPSAPRGPSIERSAFADQPDTLTPRC